MRTRTSWRNQDRLWKALGQEGAPPKPPERDPVEVLESLLARDDLRPRDRAYFERQLKAAKIKRALKNTR